MRRRGILWGGSRRSFGVLRRCCGKSCPTEAKRLRSGKRKIGETTMKKHATRVLAALLSAVLVLMMFPMAFAARPKKAAAVPTAADYAAVDAVWQRITAKEDALYAKKATSAQVTESLIAEVEASATYVSGSLRRNGDSFTWMTEQGIACHYSPYLRSKARAAVQNPAYDPALESEVETVSYAAKHGSTTASDVYVFGPYYGIDTSFTAQYQNEGKSVAAATGGTYTLYQGSNATIDNIAKAIMSGAVVMFDSHGDTDYANGEDYTTGATTSYLCLQSGDGITSADYAGYHAYYGGSYGSMKYYEVDGTAITNHMTAPAPNNMVWMAICLGMATDGLEKPFMEHGVGVVYGYSQSVTFTGDYQYEKTFWNAMKSGSSVADAIATMKARHGDWDPAYSSYSYSQARRNYVAFPIVVSAEDTYPGHGNVDTYQTVNSSWLLVGDNYTVTACSTDESKGTVSISDNVITASPKNGYYAAGYTVSPANAAKVTQDGNVFRVTDVKQDCTVSIDFAEKIAATVNYVVPTGVNQPAASSTYLNNSIQLPTPTGTPTGVSRDYVFVGWTDHEVNNTADRPQLYTGAYTVTEEATTLYAVYSYQIMDGEAGSFRLVAADRADWSGEYVITGGNHVLTADGSVLGTEIGKNTAVDTLEEAGLFVSGQLMEGVTDRYVYEFEKLEGTELYSIRMKQGGQYLACNANSNTLSTAANCGSATAQWKLSFSDGTAVLTNAAYTTRKLQYNAANAYFRCYTGGQTPVTLYATPAAEIYYTTRPGQEHTHSFTATDTLPTCTEQGYTTYTCQCGEHYVDDYVSAWGHSWDAGVVTAEPTETARGTKTFTCLRCGQTKTEELPALGCPSAGFTDVNAGSWYHKAVDFAVSGGLMKGITDTTFAPNAPMSRGMLVTMLYRLEGKPTGFDNPFTDVEAGKYYTGAVKWAAAVGVVNGVTDTTFVPDRNITREQVAAILYRYAAYKQYPVDADGELTGFVDADRASTYAVKPLRWAVGCGILKGDNAARLNPKGNATRAEVAQMMMRFITANAAAEG